MNDRRRQPGLRGPLAALLVALAVAGCGGAASSPPTPPPSAPPPSAPPPSASAPTSGGPLTEAEAVARVLAQDSRFAGIRPPDPNLIGQSAWYEVSPAVVGWRVVVTIGWGDCQAGCINRHSWVYDVDPAGAVTLVEERGDPVGDGSGDGSAGGWDGESTGDPPVAIPAKGGPWIAGRAVAGPVCPVERIPADPACADRPVAGAVIVIRDAGGAEVARATTAEDGTFLVGVPGGGSWTVEPQPAEGLLGTAPAILVEVADAPSAWAGADVAYDTGIR